MTNANPAKSGQREPRSPGHHDFAPRAAARRDLHRLGHLALDGSEQRLRIDFHELRVVAQEPAHEDATGQPLVRARFQCFDLRRRNLQVPRHVGDAQSSSSCARLASERPADDESFLGVVALVHSSRPAMSACASFDSGKLFESCTPYVGAASRSPSLRSMRTASHRTSAFALRAA